MRKYILGDDSCGADALCALCHEKLAHLFNGPIDIIPFVRSIWQVVMRDIINLVLLKELGRNNPWAVLDHLIHPFAVPYCLSSLRTTQNCQSLTLVCLGIASDANDQVGVREGCLCLFQLAHVARKPDCQKYPAVSPIWQLPI